MKFFSLMFVLCAFATFARAESDTLAVMSNPSVMLTGVETSQSHETIYN
jgi:hypothetical protein